jgi:cullin 3
VIPQVEARLQSEHQRSSHYFRITEDAIITHLKQGLITPHLINVISMPGSGLNTMIDLQQHDDLARLYTLFNLVPSGPGALKNALKASIAERGKLVNEAEGVSDDVNEMEAGPSGAGYIISRSRLPSTTHEDTNNFKPKLSSAKGKGKEKPTSNEPSAAVSSSAGAQTQGKKTLDAALKWVQDVLDLKDLFDRILKICFADDRVIQAALNEASRSRFSFHRLARPQ